MGRLDIEKQKELEPKRMEYARNQITALGYPVTEVKRHTLQFTFRGSRCRLSQWLGMVPPAIGYNRFQYPAIPPGNPNGRRKNTGLNFLLSGSTFRPRLAQNTLLSFLVFLMQIA